MAETPETNAETQEEVEDLDAEWAAALEEGSSGDGGGSPVDDNSDASAERVLDQEEIDSLLAFNEDNGGDDDTFGVSSIINSALVSYERLPMLEVVYDRMVRLLTTSLRNFTSDNVEISLGAVTSLRFGDYVNSIPLPSMLGVFKAEEWDNFGLIFVDSALIYSIGDVLLGGRRGSAPVRIEGRPFTTIERNLVERMISIVLADLSSAFEPLSPVNFVFDRLETNPRFATISRPANAAIVAKMRIDMEDRGGSMDLLVPYATLEPVRELLLQMFMGEKFGRDPIWEGHLATELWNTDIAIDAVLERQVMLLGDVLSLEVGSQLVLNATAESEVEMRCGGKGMFVGKMGRVPRQRLRDKLR